MKKIFVVMCYFLISMNLFAGDFHDDDFIIIDSKTGIAYYSVNHIDNKKKGAFFTSYQVTNIQINDISKNIKKYIFPNNNTYVILDLCFEEYIDKEKNIKIFNSNGHYTPYYVKNNQDITSEIVSNNLFIRTKNSETKEYQFWLCDKTGNNLQNIYKYKEQELVRFYIDAKIQKIIFIKSIESGNLITEIDY